MPPANFSLTSATPGARLLAYGKPAESRLRTYTSGDTKPTIRDVRPKSRPCVPAVAPVLPGGARGFTHETDSSAFLCPPRVTARRQYMSQQKTAPTGAATTGTKSGTAARNPLSHGDFQILPTADGAVVFAYYEADHVESWLYADAKGNAWRLSRFKSSENLRTILDHFICMARTTMSGITRAFIDPGFDRVSRAMPRKDIAAWAREKSA